ncbi:hypothetical protein BD311DRAFT_743414 [Dichomitus squalens]|uniref:Uncharacterized protein n=1 Tax=Dichomitus squalens TaxID=114155 RepID=A0A4V2JYM7_9APHY|nr:hypothetical protein BD311DRAFT_743414 [Dichomitus squalens]
MDGQPVSVVSSTRTSAESSMPLEDDGAPPNTESDAGGASVMLDMATEPADREIAAANQLAYIATEARNDPPCSCWDHPKSQRPVGLNLVFPPIKAEILRAIEATNTLVTLLQDYHEGQSDSLSSFMSKAELREILLLQRTTILNACQHGLETAAVHITTTPGYVCRSTNKQHHKLFEERYQVLCNVESELKKGVDEAEPLHNARNELIRAERKMRR